MGEWRWYLEHLTGWRKGMSGLDLGIYDHHDGLIGVQARVAFWIDSWLVVTTTFMQSVNRLMTFSPFGLQFIVLSGWNACR